MDSQAGPVRGDIVVELNKNLKDSSGFYTFWCIGQAVYYLVTGIWPLVSISTFQKITGPKADLWLVKTAGALITAIGLVLGVAGFRRNRSPEVPLLAVSSAAGLTAIDIIYVSRKRISPIYLLDAAGELVLIAGWLFAWLRRGR